MNIILKIQDKTKFCYNVCYNVSQTSEKRGRDMWVVRKTYWRSGQQYVQAQKMFETREEADNFKKGLEFATEIYETNLPASNKGEF